MMFLLRLPRTVQATPKLRFRQQNEKKYCNGRVRLFVILALIG